MPGPDELSLFAARLEAIGATYMITGAAAAILYGQPRVTNGLDVVLDLDESGLAGLLKAFPEEQFYLPPESVIRAIQEITGVDQGAMAPWLERMGLRPLWEEIKSWK